MTVFWIVAALFLLGALLMLLPGLLQPRRSDVSVDSANLAVHRDQLREAEQDLAAGALSIDRFVQSRAEIQRRVLEDIAAVDPVEAPVAARRTAVALALLIPLASVLTYLQLGEPASVAPSLAVTDRHSVTPEQIQKMVAALGERLKAAPDDAEGWLMLGRSYTALARYRDAATAFRRAIDLLPPNAGLLADLADVLGMANNRRLAGEPAKLVQQALDLDPRHVKALSLAGSVSFEARDYPAARAYWQRLLAVLPAESAMARSVQGSILDATQREAGAPMTAAGAAAGTPDGPSTGRATGVMRAVADQRSVATADAPPATGAASAVGGQVVISPELAGRIAAGDTVFVFARAAQGPRMPLAILRRAADGKPFDFTLDDAMAMAPNLKISGFAQVVVGARISRSGNATPQSGDLVGQSEPVRPGTQGLRIVIDRVQP
jgi:cytochrome c-type biogenesis protein CcmH